eukprot:TRINITY_DN2561_c0_g1_i2.p1 TRINITY_DN2561_c0_g1~~TRINITY_DN2561_c0_g1_i2.p1  ORF type:complete len:473 (+),score=118.87 TRINITY_DN2561_c0_g1_i2:482-1900(+)
MSLVEQQYRKNGIAKGFLKEDEYVKFSEQSYGRTMMDLCAKDPSRCYFPGDGIYRGTTEGGEIAMLYYFRNELKNMLLPHSVCPYIPTEDEKTDHQCPGYEQALNANPLQFKISKFSTMYDVQAIKDALVASNNNLGISTPIALSSIYYPNTDEARKTILRYRINCEYDEPVPCPTDSSIGAYSTYNPTGECIRCVGPVHTFDGNFPTGEDMSLEGGHCMNIVGYSDNYRTPEGDTGAFIIKNSWGDGVFGGSHTPDYFAHRISKQDDEYVCPNGNNPENWFQCSDIEWCYNQDALMTAKVMNQPRELVCNKWGIKTKTCKDPADYPDTVYFVKKRNEVYKSSSVYSYVFYEYDLKTKVTEEIKAESVPLSTLALLFKPADDSYVNDPDQCGFYTMSYESYMKLQTQFYGMFINGIEILFPDSAYAANKDKYPHLDYTLIEKSTSKQNKYAFNGPFPNYDSELPSGKKSFRA